MNKTGKGGFKEHPENSNKSGQRNSEAVAFTRALRVALVDEGNQPSHIKKLGEQNVTRYQAMIMKVWDLAERGIPWAVTYVSERVEGKVKDQIEHSGGINLDHIDVILHDGGNRDRSDSADLQ